ncbi:MAG: cation transporter [Ruminiclostridium sp.]
MKKQYILEGLCCGNCAAKIQKDISLLDGVKSASVNSDTTVLSVEFNGDAGTLVKEITRIAVSHDEDIVVKES